MKKFRWSLALLTCMSLCLSADAADTRKLLQTFRTAKDSAQRNDAFRQLLALDAKTVEQLKRTTHSALLRERVAYLRAFEKQAIRMGKLRAKSIPVAEVRALREEVLAMGALGDQLTAEILREKALPAIAKLRGLLLIQSADVLAGDARLRAQRERILTLGSQLQECITALPAKQSGAKAQTPIPAEKQLAEAEAEATIQSLPIAPASKATLATNRKLSTQIDERSVAAMRQCNLTRALLGLSVLTIDPRLIKAGVMHSKDMEKHKFFDHFSPVAGRKTPIDRARLTGTTASGENIFMSNQPLSGAEVSDAWFTSPGHHRTMVGPHNRIGIGRHNGYYTEVFGR